MPTDRNCLSCEYLTSGAWSGDMKRCMVAHDPDVRRWLDSRNDRNCPGWREADPINQRMRGVR